MHPRIELGNENERMVSYVVPEEQLITSKSSLKYGKVSLSAKTALFFCGFCWRSSQRQELDVCFGF